VPLRVEQVDLRSLVLARNDAHPDGDWWFDPTSGECLYLGLDDDTDLPALVDGVHVVVPRQPQPAGDVEAFFLSPEAEGLDADLLARLASARRGKGGLRRFRAVVQRTRASEAWSAYALRRETVRAIDWLLERGLVDEPSARGLRDDLAGHDRG
jgi:hypothetical protein